MDQDIGDIRGFVAVAELGSFREASLFLNLSQPALSRRIQKLESALGVSLFKRTTRRVELTQLGREFLPRMRRLIDELDAAFLGVREIAERRSGQVTLACIPSAAYYFLPEAIRAFNARFPQIRIRIVDEVASAILQSVLAGEADLGICVVTGEEAEIACDMLMTDPFILACRAEHPLAEQTEVAWSDLLPHRFITVGRLTANRLLLDLGLAGVERRPRWFYEVQRVATAIGLVEAGLGVAALPRLALPRGPHPSLVVRPLVKPILGRTIGIIRRRGATLPPSAQELYAMLKTRWAGAGGSVPG